MGDCSYSGSPAGLLQSEHADCRARHEKGASTIISLLAEGIESGASKCDLDAAVDPIAKKYALAADETRAAKLSAWTAALECFFSDGLIDTSEEHRLMRFAQDHGVLGEVKRLPAYRKLAQATILRDLSQGKPCAKVRFDGPMPNLQKSERLVWAFRDAEYLEDRIRKELVGISHGMSFLIAKGVTYRIGASKGVRWSGRSL